MKKNFLAILHCLCILCLIAFAGCDTEKKLNKDKLTGGSNGIPPIFDGNTIYSVCGNEAMEWAKNYDSSAPDSLTIDIIQDGLKQDTQSITDIITINKVFNALNSIRLQGGYIKGPIDPMVAPDTVIFRFTAEDGDVVSFCFMDNQLAVGDPIYSDGVLYSCTGTDALLAVEGINYVPIPSLSRESSFFAFFCDDIISNFADSFYAEKPISVSYTFYGEAVSKPIVLTDTDDITAIFEALSKISVTGKANTMCSDNGHVFEFVLSDGSSVCFSFNGHNLEWNGNIYTLDHDLDFWNLSVLFSKYSQTN